MRRSIKWAVLIVLVAVAVRVVHHREQRFDRIPVQPAQKAIAITARRF